MVSSRCRLQTVVFARGYFKNYVPSLLEQDLTNMIKKFNDATVATSVRYPYIDNVVSADTTLFVECITL
jgi:hypothetical protein